MLSENLRNTSDSSIVSKHSKNSFWGQNPKVPRTLLTKAKDITPYILTVFCLRNNAAFLRTVSPYFRF